MTIAPADTSRALGVAAVVLAVVLWPAGIVLSVLALRRSARAGRVSRAAILGLVLAVLALAATVALAIFLATGLLSLTDPCAQLGPGEYRGDDGSSLSCG